MTDIVRETEVRRDHEKTANEEIQFLLQRLRETEEANQKLQKYQCFSESHVVEHLEEDIRALRAENAKLRAAVKGETFYHSDEAANEEMNRLRAERDELRKALGYIADADYEGRHVSRGALILLAKQALTRAGRSDELRA